ncbi:8269_t:CDS:2, partial [Ambispora gerdemannii]
MTLNEKVIDIDNVVVHGPYVVNLANTSREEIFHWSVEFLKKEVARMEEIGLKTLVLHPGSAINTPTEEALTQVVKGINLVLEKSSTVRIALETMCGRGSEIEWNEKNESGFAEILATYTRLVMTSKIIWKRLNELGAKIDRHENIGYGKIGFDALKRIVYHPKFDGKIKLLETPRKREEFQEEIRLLK